MLCLYHFQPKQKNKNHAQFFSSKMHGAAVLSHFYRNFFLHNQMAKFILNVAGSIEYWTLVLLIGNSCSWYHVFSYKKIRFAVMNVQKKIWTAHFIFIIMYSIFEKFKMATIQNRRPIKIFSKNIFSVSSNYYLLKNV